MNKTLKFTVSMLLVVVMCLSGLYSAGSIYAEPVMLEADELYNVYEIINGYDNETAAEQYPNGAFVVPVAAMELKMNGFYAFDIIRQGGTSEQASITVKTNDLTACYGTDYEIYLSNYSDAAPVDGDANPYYNMTQYSFIPTVTSTGTIVEGNTAYTDSELDSLRNSISEYNDAVNELMPVSSEFELTFASGERCKRIYIKTLKCKTVRADLQFLINICNPDNASIGAEISTAVTIKEEREIPKTYISLVDSTVNPDSEVAYAILHRTGNYGTFVTVTVRTKSGTAAAGTAYEGTQLTLDLTPGMSEVKIPIEMYDGAEDNTEFGVEIVDSENVYVENAEAVIKITSSVEAEIRHETAADSLVSSSMVSMNRYNRGQQIIDLNQFKVNLNTTRGKVKKSGIGYYTNQVDGNNKYCLIKYNNYWSSYNNGIEVVSNEKIDFTGVDSVSWTIRNISGSTNVSHIGFYADSKGKLTSKMSDYDWFTNNSYLPGRGGSTNMTNISSEKVYTYSIDKSKVNGEKYLYILLHHGGLVGTAGTKIYNNTGNSTKNMHLNMTKYTISIVKPDKVELFKDGTLQKLDVVTDCRMSDPGADSSSSSTTRTSMDIYRDETTAISGNVANNYGGCVKLVGVVFCKDANGKDPSSVYKLSGGSFTLTGEVLRTYADYIKDNKIYIKPVYEVNSCTFSVTDVNTGTGGQSFKTDKSNPGKGYLYQDGTRVGTLTWNVRDNGKYYVGDEVTFNFTYDAGYNSENIHWSVKYETRMAGSTALLSVADVNTKDTGVFRCGIFITDACASVKPVFSCEDTTPRLLITNPSYGSFAGKNDTKLQDRNTNGTILLKGYTVSQDILGDDGQVKETKVTTTDFRKTEVGQILTFYAEPDDGYRARWEYTDAASGETKEYYGNTFYYAMQNVQTSGGNLVTLTFEKMNASKKYSTGLYGKALLQKGSILAPAYALDGINDTEPVYGASVTISGEMGMSDSTGQYYLETNPTMEDSEPLELEVMGDEVFRALVSYNNRYYLCDVDISKADVTTQDGVTNTRADIVLPYKTYGVTPTQISAVNSLGESLGSTIPLVKTHAVTFNMSFSDKGAESGKPVNMVRWTVENDEGIAFTQDVEVKGNGAQFVQVLSEIATHGEKLYVELFSKTYDSDANVIYHSYGKFDTGYSFISTAVEETITYAPDIGVPVSMSQPIPCIGGVSPTFSLYGLTPIVNVGSSGKTYEGHEIKTITIGISYGLVSEQMSDDKSFNSASPLDKAKAIAKKLDQLDKILNDGEKLPAFANGLKKSNALNMNTSVKLSFSVTVCYQGSYYVGDDGTWNFVGVLLIVGAGGSIKISVPFVLFYVPCFANFTVSVNANIYMGLFPETDEQGQQVPLTLQQLSDAGACMFQGVYELKIGLEVGVGIGYDGIISASGVLGCTFDMQFNDFLEGYGTVAMTGGISLELLFIKYQWKEKLFQKELFNTLSTQNLNTSLRETFKKDVLNEVTLDSMTLNISDNAYAESSDLLKAFSINKYTHETDSLVDSNIIEIGGGKYLVTVVRDSYESGKTQNNILHYFIYDSVTNTTSSMKSVLKEAYESNIGSITDEETDRLNEMLYRFDGYVDLVDCDEDILIVWSKLATDATENTSGLDVLKAAGIATIYYNKESGTFHDFRFLKSDDQDVIYMGAKAVYNSDTDTVHMAFASIDLSDMTGESTISDIQELPVTLYTTAAKPAGSRNWTDPVMADTSGKTVKYFDIAESGDGADIAYVLGSDGGFVLDSISDYENSLEQDDLDAYNTVNALYIKDFYVDADGILKTNGKIRITGDEYVTSNPTFAWVEYEGSRNLLLFYKCNGKYAYQNITSIMSQGVYTDDDGIRKVEKGYEIPDFISDEYDYSINDDMKLYADGDNILFVYTMSEGTQQQLWAKHFAITGTETVVNGDGAEVELLKGEWGESTYLTEGGIDEADTIGLYKKDFNACILDNNSLIAVYNSFDYDFSSDDDEIKTINNRFVIDILDTSAVYTAPENNAISFSDEYPENGDTITVSLQAKNTGVLPGKDVEVALYVNGGKYASQTISRWTTDKEYREFEMEYTLPDGVRADEVDMYFIITENGNVMYTSDEASLKYGYRLEISDMKITPVVKYTDDCDNAVFQINAVILNTGNADYDGGLYFRFMEKDINELTAAMSENYDGDSPVYTCYGGTEISGIKSGQSADVILISEAVNESVFEKYAGGCTAYFMGIISNDNEWKTAKADEEVNIISSYYEGLTEKPVPEKIKKLSADDMTVIIGSGDSIEKKVTPLVAAADNDFTYTSLNPDIVSVTSFGYVTGLKEGRAVIEVKSEGVSTRLTVNVVSDSSSGDIDARDISGAPLYALLILISAGVSLTVVGIRRKKAR